MTHRSFHALYCHIEYISDTRTTMVHYPTPDAVMGKTHSATVASARNFLANWFMFEDGFNKST
jgi:hypothetical protein